MEDKLKDFTYGGFEYNDLASKEMQSHLLPVLHRGQRALNLGISAGHASSPIALNGVHITGVDIDKWALELCEEEFQKVGLGNNLATVHMDAMEYLDTCDEKFDLVILSDFLMFFTKTKGIELIKSAVSKLKKGGLIWVVTKSTSDSYYGELQGYSVEIDKLTYQTFTPCHGSGVVCFYEPLEINEILKSFGVEVSFACESMNRVGAIKNVVLGQLV